MKQRFFNSINTQLNYVSKVTKNPTNNKTKFLKFPETQH